MAEKRWKMAKNEPFWTRQENPQHTLKILVFKKANKKSRHDNARRLEKNHGYAGSCRDRKKLLKYYFTLRHHFADVDQRITHTAEGSIDANAGQGSDFFEAHVGVMAQNNHFALFRRE